MGKKVIVISSSFRKNGNSETLAKEFARGAEDAGNMVDTIYLRDISLNYCKGCLSCQKNLKCVINDDASKLVYKVKDADVICFATPIYYYAISGQLKTFLDRMNPIYALGHNYKDIYLMTSSSDTNKQAMETAIKDIQGFIDCFDGAELKGIVRGTGTDNVGDILKYQDKLDEAYNYGKNI